MADVKCVFCKATIPDGYKACPECNTPRPPDNFCTNEKCEYHEVPFFDSTYTKCPKCYSETTFARRIKKYL